MPLAVTSGWGTSYYHNFWNKQMKLHQIRIEGFKRMKNVTIECGDATFLIGPNNSGKSSVLRAIELLLSGKNKMEPTDFYSEKDPETGITQVAVETVVLEVEFHDLPEESKTWKGFKGRVFNYDLPPGSEESGLKIHYRKTFKGTDVVIEMLSAPRTITAAFKDCKSPQDYINAGVDAEMFSAFGKHDKPIPPKEQPLLDGIDELWEIGDGNEWFKNPGGISGNVLNRLPIFLLIPAETSSQEINGDKGALGKTLNSLFEEVRSHSQNYRQAQSLLDALAKELDPADSGSEFGKMMADINGVLSSVFPGTEIHATADLSDPNKALKPSFDIEMSSNIRTKVEHQGTGMIRSAVFGLLRYRQQWVSKRENEEHRRLIIGFEEPEIYLHPSAANQMRDTIYDLSGKFSQIIATTHSPYMIDLSRKPRQVLNRFRFGDKETETLAFSVSDQFHALKENDQTYVKMLLKLDDHMARAFFTKTVVIVEGDTEDIVIREALHRLPKEKQLRIKSDFEVVKARGKGAIISLVKYLKSMGVQIHVIHDKDTGTEKAEQMNEPIRSAVEDDSKLTVLENCLEDVLGYPPPNSNKPFKAYSQSLLWGETWVGLPERLREVLGRVFQGYID